MATSYAMLILLQKVKFTKEKSKSTQKLLDSFRIIL